jgi:tRNA U38,U39,U40 pseudouridine synthase TruA
MLKNNPTLVLEQKIHKKKPQLLIRFSYDSFLIQQIRKIAGATWSQTLKAWYVADTKENLSLIIETFKNIAIVDSTNVLKIEPTKIVKKNVFIRNFVLY